MDDAAAIELAERLAERLCHDFAGAGQGLISGMDLLAAAGGAAEREEAIAFLEQALAAQQAKIASARRAFGRPAAMEIAELRTLIESLFDNRRARLVWDVEASRLEPASARILLVLAEIAADAAALGGEVRLSCADQRLAVEMVGPKVLLKPEVRAGLGGQPLPQGIAGRWIHGALLSLWVRAGGGTIAVEDAAGSASIRLTLRASG
ncbi:MAG TPA: histidine phosphotransferase family protein [Caulobacteraceae bacterium]|nr:histidine phosphotransferase family protein [Caulobacteraceae bacterium]